MGSLIFAGVSAAVLMFSLVTSKKALQLSMWNNRSYFNMKKAETKIEYKTYVKEKIVTVSKFSLKIENEGGKHAFLYNIKIGLIYQDYYHCWAFNPENIQNRKIPSGGSYFFKFDSFDINCNNIVINFDKNRSKREADFPFCSEYRYLFGISSGVRVFLRMEYRNYDDNEDENIKNFDYTQMLPVPIRSGFDSISKNTEKIKLDMLKWIRQKFRIFKR